MALRAAGLQFASLPFDWIGAPGIVAGAKMIASDFEGWLERGDLVLHDVRRGSFNNHIYRNTRTGYGFPHDFSSFYTFDEIFPKIAEKYARRIRRLRELLGRARKVLLVYVERPIWPRGPDADLLETRLILEGKFPGLSIDIIYFHEDPACGEPRRETVAEGITAVACDYREFDHGEVSHTVDIRPLAAYLKSAVTVTDARTEEERRSYAEGKRKARRGKWGTGNALRRKLNEIEFRIFRHLERDLIEKGVVPRDRPMWF